RLRLLLRTRRALRHRREHLRERERLPRRARAHAPCASLPRVRVRLRAPGRLLTNTSVAFRNELGGKRIEGRPAGGRVGGSVATRSTGVQQRIVGHTPSAAESFPGRTTGAGAAPWASRGDSFGTRRPPALSAPTWLCGSLRARATAGR